LARTDAMGNTPSVEWRAIPVDELLEDLIDFLSPQAQAKKITLKLNLAEEVFVKGDSAQLKRLFSNLLENALQYTPPGGTVTVSTASQDKFTAIGVEDTGIGIAPEHVPLVFYRFWRADKARSHRTEGSGLGLAIAQAIAQRHGGEIALSSQVGVGSCFEVRLPIAT
jgi:signal transduction histidine kinase